MELRFSNRIIEHLGLKLYQNRPTNVIAELVSNSWDADATKVEILLRSDHIAVLDDGIGMNSEELQNKYLKIGLNRRKRPDERTLGGRPLMGRKGIGKLAPFGVANVVEVCTIQNGKVNWIRLELSEILKEEREREDEHGVYQVPVIASDVPLREFDIEKHKTLFRESASKFLYEFLDPDGKDRRISGTAVFMGNLKSRIPDDHKLMESLGKRFTVIFLEEDFQVLVNGRKIDEKVALPPFHLRIPNEGRTNEEIETPKGKKSVTWWVGFVDIKERDWPQEYAGIGIYAHGKLVQDRPFFFHVKGREISVRYLYGVVEADWLDEQEEDLTSTDRSHLDWDHPLAQALFEWGKKKMKDWLDEYERFRKEKEQEEMEELIPEEVTRWPEAEKRLFVASLTEVTSLLPRKRETREKAARTFAKAWTRGYVREHFKRLLVRLAQIKSLEEKDILEFLDDLVSAIQKPEALLLAATIGIRLKALACLRRLVDESFVPPDTEGRRIYETHLQKFLEAFPWIFDPTWTKITANQQLRKIVGERLSEKIKEEYLRKKPDFIFEAPGKEIYVVEIKRPDVKFDLTHKWQLIHYLDIVQELRSNHEVYGLLIVGFKEGSTQQLPPNAEIVTWNDLISKAIKAHIEFLDILLDETASGDPRFDEALSNLDDAFGVDTMEKVALTALNGAPRLQRLLSSYERRLERLKKTLDEIRNRGDGIGE